MSNYKSHIIIGALIGGINGILISYINQNKKIKTGEQEDFNLLPLLNSAFCGITLGAISGILPDIIEPAKNPHHRKFFHSLTLATVLSYGIYRTQKNELLSINNKMIITTIVISYLSHLALDSITPRSLPVL